MPLSDCSVHPCNGVNPSFLKKNVLWKFRLISNIYELPEFCGPTTREREMEKVLPFRQNLVRNCSFCLNFCAKDIVYSLL